MRERARRVLYRLTLLLTLTLGCGATLELGLRAYKSLTYDGGLHLSSPSVNNVPHPELGWMSPSSVSVDKDDACYGAGTITYNAEGFRAPPRRDAHSADPVICILGDSRMQAYQLPDGQHLPHLLAAAYKDKGDQPHVLPLAVGGYGTTQQWMLYERHCRELTPDIVIHHWVENDPQNNSYDAERYGGATHNNGRPRPYLEGDNVVLRRPYPLQPGSALEGLLLIRALNALLVSWTAVDDAALAPALEAGWAVAETWLTRLADEPARVIGLVAEDQTRAIAMYRRLGIEVITHPPIPRTFS